MEPVEIFFFLMLISLSTKTIVEHDENPHVKVNICYHENKIVYAKTRSPRNTLFVQGTKCMTKDMRRSSYVKLYHKIH